MLFLKSVQILNVYKYKLFIKWILINCKQLVCIDLFDLFGPKSHSNSPQIYLKEIAKLLSDKIEFEINFVKERYERRLNNSLN
jgi:hypothetical protein